MARSIDNHKPECQCPVCSGIPDSVRVCARVDAETAAWVRAQGGGHFLRGLILGARKQMEIEAHS